MKASRDYHRDIINLIHPAGAVKKKNKKKAATQHSDGAMTGFDERASLTHRLELGQIFFVFFFSPLPRLSASETFRAKVFL